jgi:HK97 family phage major capsid protein
MTLKQLREELGSLNKERRQKADDLHDLAVKEDFTEDDQEKYDNLKEDIQQIDNRRERKQSAIDTMEEQDRIEDVPGFQGIHAGGQDGPDNQEQEIAEFSFVKAFREKLNGQPLTGLEKELHQDAIQEAKQRGASLEGNLHIPQKVLTAKSRFNQIKNELSVDGGTSGSKGGLTVDTELRSLIDILKAKLVFTGSNGLGATFFTNLTGDVEFPRAVEDSNDPDKKSETGSADEQNPTFDSLKLSPTRLPAFTEVTRKLLNQSSTSIESWLRSYLMYKLSKVMHVNIINDILGNGNVNAVTNGTDGGSLDWGKVVEFETKVANADADEPSMAFLTNPKVRGALKTTSKESGQAIYLWDTDNLVNSYMAVVSTIVPDDLTKGEGSDLSAAIFGNWASLYIAQWGGFDFLVNPFSNDTEGIIRINAWTFFDNGLRHPEAFAASQDIKTS